MIIKRFLIGTVTLVCLAILFGFLCYNGILWFVYPEYSGYSVKGIDVARYQGDIDWQEISSQDIKFAFMKATEGSSYADPKFDKNIVSSRDNGIYAGAYHFFSSQSAGKTQAENFIGTVGNYEFDLPPVLDFEIPETIEGKDVVIAEAKVWLDEIERFFGVKPIIYTTYESYQAFLTEGFDDYPLWFRDLFKEPQIREGQDWTFWQYSNRGRLKGIDPQQKYVDLNVFHGTSSEFQAYIEELSLQMTGK